MRRAPLLLLLALVPASAAAQETLFRVYGWETPMRGWLEPALWTGYVAQSDLPGGRDGLWAHSLELEYGLTDNIAIGGYLDFQDPSNGGFRYTRTRALFRWSWFDKYTHWLDPALYVEYYAPRGDTGDPEELETRLILEKDLNHFRLDLNPTFSKVLSGDEVTTGLEFGFAGGLYYRRYYAVQPGIEYYDRIGPLQDPLPSGEQQHYLAPMLNVRWGRGWWWEVRTLIGLSDGSDKLILQSYLSYEFPTIVPSRQAY